MNLFIAEVVARFDGDTRSLFRIAHVWKFGHDQGMQNAENDMVRYRVSGIVPQYLREYAEHLQRSQGENLFHVR